MPPSSVKDAVRAEMTATNYHLQNGVTPRRSTTGKLSSISIYSNKGVNKPQGLGLQSRYGQAKVDTCPNNSENHGDYKIDAAFIRQLLAMNKKAELLLNKKLAQIMRDEPEVASERRKVRNRNFERYSSSSITESDTDLEQSQLVMNNRKLSKRHVAHRRNRVEYDLNGRRVYLDKVEDDNASVGADGDVHEGQVEIVSTDSQSWFNTTTLIQAKSDVSCSLDKGGAVTAQRKSLTLFNQQSMGKSKPRDRCLSLCSERRGQQRSCFTPEREPKDKETVFCKGTVLGDGVQNVVAHCCEVDLNRSSSKKRVQRVWNYRDIPKVQSGGVKTVEIRGDPKYRSNNGRADIKLKTTIPPVHKARLPNHRLSDM